jgi:hypothetical protein
MREAMDTTPEDQEWINHLVSCNRCHGARHVVLDGKNYVTCLFSDRVIVWDEIAIRNRSMWKSWPTDEWQAFEAHNQQLLVDNGFSLEEIEKAEAIMEGL